MSEFRVGQEIPDHATGKTPRGTLLRHRGVGYLEIVELPIEPPKVGDVIDTEEQARLLPVGSVVVHAEGDDDTSAASLKVGDDRWSFYSRFAAGPETHGLYAFRGEPYRVVFIPDRADARASG